MSICVVIPARLNSTRLPRKLLLEATGRPLIQHTYENVKIATKSVRAVETVVVLTEDREIYDAVMKFGGKAWMTRLHENGTSRIAEFAKNAQFDYYVNVQGDEPEVSQILLRQLFRHCERQVDPVVTVSVPFDTEESRNNPNRVKVVVDRNDRAIYFSRQPLPGSRRHLGLYAYTRQALQCFEQYLPGSLEVAERLEQLRFLENRMSIQLLPAPAALGQHVGIDTVDDYREFVLRSRRTADAQSGHLGSGDSLP